MMSEVKRRRVSKSADDGCLASHLPVFDAAAFTGALLDVGSQSYVVLRLSIGASS